MSLLKRLTLETRQASVMTANVHQQKAQANSHGKEEKLHKNQPWLLSAVAGWWSNIYVIIVRLHMCLAERITFKDA